MLLKYRAYKIYTYNPDNINFIKPKNYDKLNWQDFLPKNENIKDIFEQVIKKNKKNKAVLSINKYGWVFNDFMPLGSK